VEDGETRVVAKDYRACCAPYRWIVGRINLRLEQTALERLDGIDAVPRYLGRSGRWILLMTWFSGRDVGKAAKAKQTPEFFDRLLAAVREMHARGVVHLDLRQRRNILLRPGGLPGIIDFGGALSLTPGGRLHRRLAAVDVSGVLKYKRRAQPDAVTDEEHRLLDHAASRRRLWPFG
jgi:RIO-like serine/threonine protein kinase